MLLAFVVSLLAGLATAVGGAIVVWQRTPRRPMMAVALAFASGAMLMVSMAEILPKASQAFAGLHGERLGLAWGTAAFLAGLRGLPWRDDTDPDFPIELPTTPESRRVLFAGDVPGARWALLVAEAAPVEPTADARCRIAEPDLADLGRDCALVASDNFDHLTHSRGHASTRTAIASHFRARNARDHGPANLARLS